MDCARPLALFDPSQPEHPVDLACTADSNPPHQSFRGLKHSVAPHPLSRPRTIRQRVVPSTLTLEPPYRVQA
jgi:hypothetical protein